MDEIWKQYIYHYDVSNLGRIRNRATGHILKQHSFENGYYGCVVSCGSRSDKQVIRTHVAVAKLFVDNPLDLSEVNHKDGDKSNNVATNLEWCTHSDNMKHAIQNGLFKISSGENHGAAKLKREDVNFIRLHYIPRDRQYGARALARMFNVHHSVVSDIINNKIWQT